MESSLIIKLFGLLEASAGFPEGRSLAELAADVGLAKPTAHRILKTLVALGYMERAGAGVYRQAAQLGRIVTGYDDQRLIRAAGPAMRDLWETTGETVNLGALRQARVVYLAVLETPQPLRRTVNPSMSDPFACTALGRAMVAHLPEERQVYLLKHTAIEKRTPHTIVEPAKLRAILSEAREKGYTIEENETDIGCLCVGAPVFDASGVVAALSVSAPTARVSHEQLPKLASLVKKAAKHVSDRLRSIKGD